MINLRRHGEVALVELAHGKVNAIDVELLEELGERLGELASDRDVHAVVLTGAGSTFSAGVDLKRVIGEGPDYTERLIVSLRTTLESLFVFPKPTVAAVNGAAIAGGCVMACACDRRLAAPRARIGASELLVGVSFPAAALEIVRAACADHATEAILGGQVVEGDNALSFGFVHEVVETERLLERALSVADELGSIQPDAFALAKHQLRRPAFDEMRRGASDLDPRVIRQWADADTRSRIERQLQRLADR